MVYHKFPGHTKAYTQKWRRIRAVNNQISNLKGDRATKDKAVIKLRETRSKLMRQIKKMK